MVHFFKSSLSVPLALTAALSAASCSTSHGEGQGPDRDGKIPMMPAPQMLDPEPMPVPLGLLIASVSPPLGPTTGGTLVRIKGSGFVSGPDLRVSFGEAPATAVRWISENELEATTPERLGRPGLLNVRVINPDGTSATADGAFRYFYGRLGFGARASLSPYALSWTGRLVAGDVDGDGLLDVFVCGEYRGAHLLWGDGRGGFERAESIATRNCWGAAVGDTNGDKLPDLIYGDSGSGASVLKGTGRTRTFSGSTYYTGASAPTYTPLLADVTADGLSDLLLLGSDGNQGSFFAGRSAQDLNFQSKQFVSGSSTVLDAAIVDLNGDGKPDLINSLQAGGLAVLLGNGDGTFLSPRYYTNSACRDGVSLVMHDVNNDGRPDLITGGSDALCVFLNTGGGSFVLESTIPTAQQSLRLASFDFNGDGRLDLLSAHAGNVTVLRGAVGSPFAIPISVPTGARSAYQATFGDLNGDGRPDLVTAGSDGLEVFLNSSE